MAEIYELARPLSVFRDGEYVGELTRPEFTSDRIIEMMVGRKLEDLYPEKTARTVTSFCGCETCPTRSM